MTENTQTTNKVKPIHKIRLSGGASAAIWQNTTKDGKIRYSVTIDRTYKDASGQWKKTSRFGVEDLLALAKVADLAHDYIRARFQEDAAE